MYRTKYAAWIGVACVLALTLACSKRPAPPTAPSSTTTVEENAAPDGSTLKVTAPTIVSPTGDTRLTTRQPTLTLTNSTGKFANTSYSYEFQLMTDGGSLVRSATIAGGGGTTSWPYPEQLERDTPYRWRARATALGAVGPWSSTGRFFTVRENRTPDPDPNSICFDSLGNVVRNCIPAPNRFDIVQQVVDRNPGILSLKRSCQRNEFGGDHITGWEFLDKVVDALRETDTRWGYNGKRGNPNDPSEDVITYHYGPGPDQGSNQVWVYDIMLSHCGAGSAPTWNHITNVFGAGAVWTSRGRF